MAYCYKCGRKLVPGSRFCGGCGTPVAPNVPDVPPVNNNGGTVNTSLNMGSDPSLTKNLVMMFATVFFCIFLLVLTCIKGEELMELLPLPFGFFVISMILGWFATRADDHYIDSAGMQTLKQYERLVQAVLYCIIGLVANRIVWPVALMSVPCAALCLLQMMLPIFKTHISARTVTMKVLLACGIALLALEAMLLLDTLMTMGG